eukprot:5675033-Prorocentrum_lima.AAC.1
MDQMSHISSLLCSAQQLLQRHNVLKHGWDPVKFLHGERKHGKKPDAKQPQQWDDAIKSP